MNEETNKPPAKISDAQRQVAAGEDFKDIKCTLSGDEFHAMRWAAQRSRDANGKTLPLANFMRGALLERVREVVRGEIANGKKVPADIAAVIDEHRRS